MKTFLIESDNDKWMNAMPVHDFGFACIKAIEFLNWWRKEELYNYKLCTSGFFKSDFNKNNIPVGSVEFVLRWLGYMGRNTVLPLNIPRELWGFVKRDVGIFDISKLNGKYFCKSITNIKHENNGMIKLPGKDGKTLFATEWIENVKSEWRIFVWNKKIVGIRCYSGDEWIIPDKKYCEEIVSAYDKKSYTLDVMIYDGVTDIIELHDFFSCGLYGWEDPVKYLQMLEWTISDLLKNNT